MLGVRGATPGKEKYRTLYTSIDERASESARGGVSCVCVCVCVCSRPPRRAGWGCLWCSVPDLPVRMLLFGMVLFLYFISGGILSPTRPLVAYSPLTLASLRMLPCRTHCPRPSMCIMYGCGTACGTTLFARYCHVTPRQKPPKVGFGWFGDGAPPGAVRAWMDLSGRFLISWR